MVTMVNLMSFTAATVLDTYLSIYACKIHVCENIYACECICRGAYMCVGIYA